MKFFSMLAILALVPLAFAAPNAQVGSQTGTYWSEYATVVVQGGTGYELHGIAGDHDIRFYNAAGSYVGGAFACGADAGNTPASAVSARILVWDHDGELFPCSSSPLDALPSSVFIYVDGL